jgi:hypothetical protein
MVSMRAGSVKVQSSATSEPAPPCWFGEVVLTVTYLGKGCDFSQPGRGRGNGLRRDLDSYHFTLFQITALFESRRCPLLVTCFGGLFCLPARDGGP